MTHDRSLAGVTTILVLVGSLCAISMTACGPPQVVTIMSANITSGRYSAYEGPGIRIFQGLEPDIVLVQEFNYEYGTLRDLVDEAFGPTFSYSVEPGDDNIPNGVISRYPIIDSGQWADSSVPDRDFAWAVIDIPGAIDLQVVSVHLKSSSSSAGQRNDQANDIRSYVASQFDASQYIAVGGDLNVYHDGEGAVNTFRTFLDVDSHIPTDPYGNENTNEPRSKPYDWLMPNHLLDDQHVPLEVGTRTFTHGLVFDSEAYPSPLPLPIYYGDSHVEGMQHMSVMKAYEFIPFPELP